MNLRLGFRVVDRTIFREEVGLRLSVWNTETRTDGGPGQDCVVKDLLDEDVRLSIVMRVPLAENKWPVDARIHFEAAVFAESADGPPVGEPGGTGSLTFRELKEHVAAAPGHALRIPLQQLGVDQPKMTVILEDFGPGDRARVAAWQFEENASRSSLTPASMDYHNQILKRYAFMIMWKFSQEADARGVRLLGVVPQVKGLHLPIARLNVPVPHPMYWMLAGDVPSGSEARALEDVFSNLLDMALRRMNWTQLGRSGFIGLVRGQTALKSVDTPYNDDFTDACAIMAHVCSIISTQFYYKSDEAHVGPGGRTRAVELFFDALHMIGGDCEDTGSLICRTFLWLRTGNADMAAKPTTNNYHRTYGGWSDPGVDALQRVAHWYSGVGCIGSVTSARVEPGAGGEAASIRINGQMDRDLPVGGHAYTVFIPVVRLEELVSRMNPTTFGAGTAKLRPTLPGGRYPAWCKKMPTMVGEGTGDLHPLVLPPAAYYYNPAVLRDREDRHTQMMAAFKLLRGTKVLRRLQVQRHSPYKTMQADMRIGSFYRRATHAYCADLQGHYGATWIMKGPRTTDSSSSSSAAGIRAIPGDPGPTDYPRLGVNMRDIILAANDGVYGNGNPEIAIALDPKVEDFEHESFVARGKQLRPWSLPRITPAERTRVAASFAVYIQDFEATAKKKAVRDRAPEDPLDVVLALRFRRNEFALDSPRRAALVELTRLRAYIVDIKVHFEYPSDNAYGVCVMVHMVPPAEDDDCSAGGSDGKQEE